MGSPFRIEPQGRPTDYKTYQITQPVSEKTRIGSCEAAGCERNLMGWRSTVPLLSASADYIRNQSGRRFRETVVDGMSQFDFYPGQQCFTEHHVADRPQEFSVRKGDWRADLGLLRAHRNGSDWVEDFGEHQLKLKEQQERG